MSNQQQKYQFTLGKTIADIDKIQFAIDTIAASWKIDEKPLFHLNLILEELISNTMVYGYIDKSQGQIAVELSFDGAYIAVEIKDDAVEFDPTEMLAVQLEFVQRLCEDIQYKYRNQKNELRFRMKVK